MPTLAAVRARVQVKLNDTDGKNGSLDTLQVDHAIADACLSLGSQIEAPHVYLSSAFTISAGASTFTLPTAAQTGYASLTQYAGDVRIRLTNRLHFLTKKTVEEIDSLREYNSTTTQGYPECFCLWEEMDNDMQGRCWPNAGVAEPCDLFVSLVPDDLRDANDMDAANVRFSRYGSTALVYYTSALLAAAMSAEDLGKRRLNPNVVQLWRREGDVLLYQDAVRKHNAENHGRIQRWVS